MDEKKPAQEMGIATEAPGFQIREKSTFLYQLPNFYGNREGYLGLCHVFFLKVDEKQSLIFQNKMCLIDHGKNPHFALLAFSSIKRKQDQKKKKSKQNLSLFSVIHQKVLLCARTS